MVNMIYLVLLMNISSGTASVAIPQANMNQCLINKKNLVQEGGIYYAYCVVGVKQ